MSRAAVDLLAPIASVRRRAVEELELDGPALFMLRQVCLLDDHALVRCAAAARLGAAGTIEPSHARGPGRGPVAGWLVEALGEGSARVREAACASLARVGEVGDPGLEPALERVLTRDPTWWVRRAAARALAAVSGPRAIDALVEALRDPFWRVRHGIIQALALIVDRSAEHERERSALRDRILARGAQLDDEPGRAALAYLASAWPQGEGDVPAVLGIIRDPGAGLELSDPDPAVVTARLRAAGERELDVDALIALLAESHEALRDEASRRLAALGDPLVLRPALAWLEDPRMPNAPATVRRLLARLGSRARPLVDAALASGQVGGLAWALGWIGDHPAEDLRDAVVELAAHDHAAVRAAALATCGRLLARERGHDEALRAILVAGVGDPALLVRDAAALALLGNHDHQTVGRAATLQALSARVRAAALAQIGDPELAQELFDDPDPRVRAAAIGLRELAIDERTSLLADPDPWIRAAALDLEGARALVLVDPDPCVRRAAARVVLRGRARLTAGERLELARALASQLDPWLRARALALLDPDDASHLRLVLRASRDEELAVRGAAAGVLEAAEPADLREQLEAMLEGELDEDLRVAAWSTLLLATTLDRQQAARRLARARAHEPSSRVHEHLEELAVVFGAEPPRRSIEPREGAAPGRTHPAHDQARHRVELGATGIELAPLILSGAHGLPPRSLAFAARSGVDTFFWEPRYGALTRFLRRPSRRALQVIAGSFHADREGLLHDLDTARRRLERDHIDLFLVFWVRSPARLGPEVLGALREFRERGWIRAYGFSTHDRAIACEAITSGDWPVVMTRHSAAHHGAERELFPAAARAGAGVLSFSALCYGRMLRPSGVLERGPRAVDCYRYSLSQPAVSACVSAPRHHRELVHNLELLDAPTLALERLEVLRAHGREIYADSKRFDRLVRRGGAAPLREAILELFTRASQPWADDLDSREWSV